MAHGPTGKSKGKKVLSSYRIFKKRLFDRSFLRLNAEMTTGGVTLHVGSRNAGYEGHVAGIFEA